MFLRQNHEDFIMQISKEEKTKRLIESLPDTSQFKIKSILKEAHQTENMVNVEAAAEVIKKVEKVIQEEIKINKELPVIPTDSISISAPIAPVIQTEDWTLLQQSIVSNVCKG